MTRHKLIRLQALTEKHSYFFFGGGIRIGFQIWIFLMNALLPDGHYQVLWQFLQDPQGVVVGHDIVNCHLVLIWETNAKPNSIIWFASGMYCALHCTSLQWDIKDSLGWHCSQWLGLPLKYQVWNWGFAKPLSQAKWRYKNSLIYQMENDSYVYMPIASWAYYVMALPICLPVLPSVCQSIICLSQRHLFPRDNSKGFMLLILGM